MAEDVRLVTAAIIYKAMWTLTAVDDATDVFWGVNAGGVSSRGSGWM
jgi:hypothetical protein